MTEREWLTCTAPLKMLLFLRGKATDRQLRLFAAACCRSIWALLPPERGPHAVEVAERYADGLADADELAAACDAAADVRGLPVRRALLLMTRQTFSPFSMAAHVVQAARRAQWGYVTGARQCALLRDIAGNPFRPARVSHSHLGWHRKLLRPLAGNRPRPVTIPPSLLAWHNGAVVRLARAAYEERNLPSGTLHPDRLAALADALQQAGCTEERLLAHLHSDGEHVRGCWVVDLLSGRR